MFGKIGYQENFEENVYALTIGYQENFEENFYAFFMPIYDQLELWSKVRFRNNILSIFPVVFICSSMQLNFTQELSSLWIIKIAGFR